MKTEAPRSPSDLGRSATELQAPASIDEVRAAAYVIPTGTPESDGTLEWDHTTLVTVEISAGGVRGLGYTYDSIATAVLVTEVLKPHVLGASPWDIPAIVANLYRSVRNVGRQGIAAAAISAVDVALWDLKARLLGLPIVDLLGAAREAIPGYGSGGFTSYDDDHLARQLGGWARDGFGMVKMKVGREPARDPARVAVARDAIGPAVELFVDGNGAYDRAGARRAAAAFAASDVRWLEEPVTSDDVDGLRLVRDTAPPGMAIAAGEYGWDQFHFRRLLEAGAVDVLQADATRCGGVTGFLVADALCRAHTTPLSTHCAPALHVPLACAASRAVHLEWFHDHARIEARLLDGAPQPRDGRLSPDRSRPGFGLGLRQDEAAPYLEWRSW